MNNFYQDELYFKNSFYLECPIFSKNNTNKEKKKTNLFTFCVFPPSPSACLFPRLKIDTLLTREEKSQGILEALCLVLRFPFPRSSLQPGKSDCWSRLLG